MIENVFGVCAWAVLEDGTEVMAWLYKIEFVENMMNLHCRCTMPKDGVLVGMRAILGTVTADVQRFASPVPLRKLDRIDARVPFNLFDQEKDSDVRYSIRDCREDVEGGKEEP